LGKRIIGGKAMPGCATKSQLFLESGMNPGLEFAIMYVGEIETLPEQDRREIIASTTYPFGR
jgi:hypothetical protein